MLGWLEDIRPGVAPERHVQPPLRRGQRVHCPRCTWARPDTSRTLRKYRRHWYRKHVD